MNKTVWRHKYKNLADYYKNEYNQEYYEFDKYELEIDPDETPEDIEKYDQKRIRLEIAKCNHSFTYFAHKYAKILHPKHGLVPFILFKYQRDTVGEYDVHRYNIIKKFRQGGLTTVTEIWGMWRCLFRLDQQILFLSKTDSEAITAGEIVNTAAKYLPSWMKPDKDGKWNDHQKEFRETGCKMVFGTPERARGLAITYLILDEAAFIPDMNDYWKAMYPTLSAGGSCIVISTVNGLGNWYAETYHNAIEQKNDFNVIDLHYTKHPEYHNDKWVKDQRTQLGEKGWQQEVLGNFLNSGETYIPPHIIGELQERTRHVYPLRKKFAKFSNAGGTDDEKDGALWVFKEPKDGHEYIVSVDVAEGIGDEGDNSCIEIFDSNTLEQVAEFYSNIISIYMFSQVVYELGLFYNTGLVVVEDMGPGGAVLNTLQHESCYDNLYYEGKLTSNPKPGIKMTGKNRPIILESLQHRLMNGTVTINSRRFVKELNTFIFNPKTHKAEARKGSHDDAIMSVCIALFVRDSMIRDIPIGADSPTELDSPFKQSICDEIRREILADSPKDLFKDINRSIDDDDTLAGIVLSMRPHHKILSDFGW